MVKLNLKRSLGRETWLFRILLRLNRYFYIMIFFILLLYGVGSFQSFADSTYVLIFRVLGWFCFAFIASAFSLGLFYLIPGVKLSSQLSRSKEVVKLVLKILLVCLVLLGINLLNALFHNLI